MADTSTPEFQSLPNFRAVVPGKLYRSSSPDNVTSDDVARLESLGIKTIVDFRMSKGNKGGLLDNTFQVVQVKVQNRKPQPPKFGFTVKGTGFDNGKRHFFINFYDGQALKRVLQSKPWYIVMYIIFAAILALIMDTILRTRWKYLIKMAGSAALGPGLLQLYKNTVDFSPEPIFAALKVLLDPQNQPAMFCCNLGKDRTGIIAALALGLLGRKKRYISEDYHKTEEGLKPIYLKAKKSAEELGLPETFCLAPAETMQQLLEYIDQKYGSVESYLLSIGFSAEDLNEMKANLSG